MVSYLISFLDMLNPNGFTLVEAIILLATVLALSVTLYVFKSIAIYKLAKNHGVEKAFLAWIPFAWIYIPCVLVKEFLFFGTPYGKIALPVCIIFCVYGGLSIILYTLIFIPEIIYIASGREVIYTNLAITLLEKVELIMALLGLAKTIVEINLYIVLFRKYLPQYYIVVSVLSIFGLFPIMVFLIRNKVAMSFEQYVRTMNSSSNNAYRETSQPKPSKKDDPFSEFGDDDPFSDF